MNFVWEEGYRITVNLDNDTAVISANREGLLSLANHLTALADEAAGSHFHLDKWNSLEDDSADLVIEKVE